MGVLFPVNDRFVVEVINNEETVTKTGIILTSTGESKPKKGKVLAVGNGYLTDSGVRVPLTVKRGDIVYYQNLAGAALEVAGKIYRVLVENEVLAIEKED